MDGNTKKAFLLFKKSGRRGIGCGGGARPSGSFIRFMCVVLASSAAQVAETCGGILIRINLSGEIVNTIHFPENLFVPNKEGSEYFEPGELLEYHCGPLCLAISDQDWGETLHMLEMPLLQEKWKPKPGDLIL